MERVIGVKYLQENTFRHFAQGGVPDQPDIDWLDVVSGVRYLIDWKGNFAPSWEPRANLTGCKACVAAFWAAQAAQGAPVLDDEVAWANS